MTEPNPRSFTGMVVGLVVVGVIALGAAGLSAILYGRNTNLTARVGLAEKALVDAGLMKAKGKKGAAGGKGAAPKKKPATGGSATQPATATQPAKAPAG